MRLIDADALEEEIRTKDIMGGLNYSYYIKNAPTIERKTGKWVQMYEPKNMSVCSNCGKPAYMYNNKTTAFCPNCGADMRGM